MGPCPRWSPFSVFRFSVPGLLQLLPFQCMVRRHRHSRTMVQSWRQSFFGRAGDVLTFDANYLSDESIDLALVTLDGSISLLGCCGAGHNPSSSLLEWESGYHTFSFVLPTTGTHQLGFGVSNTWNHFIPSALLIDRFRIDRFGDLQKKESVACPILAARLCESQGRPVPQRNPAEPNPLARPVAKYRRNFSFLKCVPCGFEIYARCGFHAGPRLSIPKTSSSN